MSSPSLPPVTPRQFIDSATCMHKLDVTKLCGDGQDRRRRMEVLPRTRRRRSRHHEEEREDHVSKPIVTWLVRPRWGSEEDPKIFADAYELAAFIRDGWDGDGSHSYCMEARRYAVLRLVDGVIDPEWTSVT